MRHILLHLAISPLLLITLGTGCSVFTPSWINENSKRVEPKDTDEKINGVDGPTSGHFDENGRWIPDNKEIELTYKIPDISGGYVFDIKEKEHIPTISVELFEIDTTIDYVGKFKFDAGVGYQRTFLYVGKLWTNIFEISTGGFVGWNWESEDTFYGIGFTITSF